MQRSHSYSPGGRKTLHWKRRLARRLSGRAAPSVQMQQQWRHPRGAIGASSLEKPPGLLVAWAALLSVVAWAALLCC